MKSRGFTLIELLITVAIVALLASVAMPLAELTRQREQEHELRRALREIRDALDAYRRAAEEGRVARRADESPFPPTLATLALGVADSKSANGATVYFLRRVPRDPLHPDPETPAEKTWGLRSYDSPPDKPRPGKDVYDVYSLSPAKGLNGIPYREW
jgi:general secretion pathway protein G